MTLGFLLFIGLFGCGDRGGGYVVMGPVASTNYPPVANAGNAQSVVAGVAVVLDGSKSSDSNGDTLTCAWNLDAKPAGSNAVLFDDTTMHPTFTPDRSGPYTISLVVSDGLLMSQTSTVVISTVNTAPVANAGPDQNVDVGSLVTLDGSASSDVNGDSLTYQWTMYPPSNSAAILSGGGSAKPTFTPDLPGTYTINLYVSDGIDGASYTVNVNAGLTAVAKAGSDQYLTTGPSTTVTLDGSGSYDTLGRSLTYAWSFTRRPIGSNAMFSDPSAVKPSFSADLEGIYEIKLVIMYNGYVNSTADFASIIVITDRPVTGLAFNVTDAEYSKQLDRIVMVSGTPSNQIHIYDPVGDVDQTVDLSALPTSVSVSPDGLFAAVGHSGAISHVNLVSKAVATVLPVGANLADVVLAGNGYVYAMPNSGEFFGVNLNTGLATTKAGYLFYGDTGMRAKLHPSGSVLYATALNIQKYDISGGTPVYMYDSSSIPGRSYVSGGELWMLEDGTGIVTRCASVFSASTGITPDLAPYKAVLEGMSYDIGVQHADDSSGIKKIAAIPRSLDFEVRIFDGKLFTLQDDIALPHFLAGGSDYAGHGKFVFFNSAGTNMYVIMQADTAAGLVNDFGIVKY